MPFPLIAHLQARAPAAAATPHPPGTGPTKGAAPRGGEVIAGPLTAEDLRVAVMLDALGPSACRGQWTLVHGNSPQCSS